MKKMKDDFLEDLKEAIKQLEEKGELPGEKFAYIISTITNFEIKEGGPYSIKPRDGIKNADFGLNLLIAYFLLLCKVDLPELDSFIDEKIKNSPSSSFLSSEELNTFLSKWQNRKKIEIEKRGDRFYTEEEQKILDLIVDKLKKHLISFPLETQNLVQDFIRDLFIKNINKQIPFITLYCRQAMKDGKDKFSDDEIAEFGLANVFFWASSMIYDDFWDEDEKANPKLLPVANLFTRHYINFYKNYLKEEVFIKFLNNLMDKLDGANNWEILYCRTKVEGSKFILPDKLPEYQNYEKKFAPASGHILGPMAMLSKIGFKEDSEEFKNLIVYFENYLISRQLSDDAHDWEKDMRQGHLSTVVVMLLEDLHWTQKEIDLEKDLFKLKEVFLLRTLDRLFQVNMKHISLSRNALKSIKVFSDFGPLDKFISFSEESIKKALKEKDDSLEFLKALKF